MSVRFSRAVVVGLLLPALVLVLPSVATADTEVTISATRNSVSLLKLDRPAVLTSSWRLTGSGPYQVLAITEARSRTPLDPETVLWRTPGVSGGARGQLGKEGNIRLAAGTYRLYLATSGPAMATLRLQGYRGMTVLGTKPAIISAQYFTQSLDTQFMEAVSFQRPFEQRPLATFIQAFYDVQHLPGYWEDRAYVCVGRDTDNCRPELGGVSTVFYDDSGAKTVGVSALPSVITEERFSGRAVARTRFETSGLHRATAVRLLVVSFPA